MQIDVRIQHSWQALRDALSGAPINDARLLSALQHWIREDLSNVAPTTAERVHASNGIRLVLAADPGTLPMASVAVDRFMQALLQDAPSNDPIKYVDFVAKLCSALTLFVRDDGSCSNCQYALELWTDGERDFEICELGHAFDSEGFRVNADVDALRPANRNEVLRRYPNAKLVAV